MTDVAVIIPSFEGAPLLDKFLPPLFAALDRCPGDHQVIVVDNASTDGTVELLTERFPRVTPLRLDENRGFSIAVNEGLALVDRPWTLSLNNDIHVEPDFLPPLVAATDDDALFSVVPRILLPAYGGAVESVVEAEFRDGFIQFVQPGLDEPGPSQDEPRTIFFGVGGCTLYHTERLRTLGGFDADYYPFYWEDIDLGYRAWRHGWTVRYVPDSVVHHRHRGTISRRYEDRQIQLALLKNQLLFHWKNIHDPDMLRRHVEGVALRVLADDARADRLFLEALVLALEDADTMLAKRDAEANLSGVVPIRERDANDD